jgi:hypothetical protein
MDHPLPLEELCFLNWCVTEPENRFSHLSGSAKVREQFGTKKKVEVVRRTLRRKALKQCACTGRSEVSPLEIEAVASADHDRDLSAFQLKKQVEQVGC